jgi:type IV pilus assembly protein PilM
MNLPFKKSSKKGLVGLDIGSSSVKAIELQGRLNNLALVNLGYENLQPDTVVDGQIMELNDVSHVVGSIFDSQRIRTDRVAAGVSGSSVIIKSIVVPKMSQEELEESIEWHAEEHIPFDISDVSLDYQIVGQTDDALQVLMAACKRDCVANIKQAIQLAGKEPLIIDVDAFALQNCYEVNYEPSPDDTVALLNIGAATTNLNILHGTRSVFTRDVAVGGSHYTATLQKELGLSFEQAEMLKRGAPLPDSITPEHFEQALALATDMLVMEIRKTFDFYRATTEEHTSNVGKILLSGGGSKLPGLAAHLAQNLEIPVEPFNPFRRIKVDTRRFDPDYLNEVVPEMAIAVGLALRGVEA